MFRRCAGTGRSIGSPPADWSTEDRDELALETVAVAIRSFHDYALVKGEWNPDAGASLKTYFVGNCVLEFPNVFRAWERERRRWVLTDPDDHVVLPSIPSAELNLEDQVVDRAELRELLADLDKPTAIAIALIAEGYMQNEVAEILQTTKRAVEACSRWFCRAGSTTSTRRCSR